MRALIRFLKSSSVDNNWNIIEWGQLYIHMTLLFLVSNFKVYRDWETKEYWNSQFTKKLHKRTLNTCRRLVAASLPANKRFPAWLRAKELRVPNMSMVHNSKFYPCTSGHKHKHLNLLQLPENYHESSKPSQHANISK